MAETVVSMARALVGVAVSKAASAAAHEASLLLGVQKEIWYIKDELKTIQAFLRAAEVEKNKGELLKVWAEQVQDLSYDIEDCLDEFKVHVKSQSLSGQLLKLGDRHRIAVRIHNLKSRVEEVSNRNTRYSLIKTTSSSSTDERDSYMEDMRNQSVNNIVESELVGFASPKMDLLKLIDISSDDGPTKVICVVGMGGLGKTTLARKTYESKEDIPSYFPCCAWVIVSQSFDRKEILKDMIRQLLGADSLNKLLKELQGKLLVQVQHLADCLVHGLKDKRYFVVLDDLWSIDAWNWINDIAFPKINNRGSRILITTRDAGLAERCTSEPLIYHLEPLQIDDAVHLLLRKTSKGQKVMETGENMKNIVTKLVKKCGRLPLAILTVGGILATKKIAEWGKFYKELPSELESNPNLEAMRRIVILSYNHLPSHLKPCFLYLSIFPEDFAIQRKRLVDRWIAEGFVKARDAVNIEDVGDSYFNELINRSMIQPSAVNIEGVVKKCRVHDIMRDIMVSVSREQNFVLLTKDNITSVEEETICHVAFHGNQFSEICLDWSSVRSVSVFGCRPMELVPSFCSPQLRMLRVLDLEDVKFRLTQKDVKNIGLLHHMKYLNIAGGSYDLALLRSIGKLQCLQTLDMREANISALPTAITELKSLCSLRCSKKLDYGYFNLIDNPKGCMTITMCFPMIFATLLGFSDWANLIAEIQLACSTRWSDTKGVRLPRGIKPLKKLQILEDADPVHYGFLKYLFIHSCEPYFNFIKSWIYRASVDDPYEEFLITQTENKDTRGDSSDILDEFTPFPLKGRNHVSAPCFLKEICHPLLRTGQQLQVLMKLLKSCNLSATGGDTYPSHNTIRLEGVLPWFNTPIESSMNSFTFSKSSVEAGTCKRDAMYKLMMEKLQHFFSNVELYQSTFYSASSCHTPLFLPLSDPRNPSCRRRRGPRHPSGREQKARSATTFSSVVHR